MSLKDTLMQDLKVAMKEKDIVKKNTIQLVRSAILQIEKDNHTELDDSAIIEVIASQVKKRKSSLTEFEKSDRNDLIEELNKEIEILMDYLPKQLTDEELEQVISQVIAEVDATSMKDMGKVMSAVSEQIAGKADNQRVSTIVKQKLSS
ncbi:hypothetical protein EDC18_101349 [Natranaerovirga pectinivora]|uniref:GatB/YqeY domain-containing protein n=1 Tax=Natranaerovirga pectinivora TaxID=682400 RepID=A0A4R3MRB4_9FIRM|nr:GatB/YqeY domain-containing protein [Natranaerovirga pectinivora]TCT17053.1 hypothetical protein EDC18_101349 [Natranaerovirga pectinivora]